MLGVCATVSMFMKYRFVLKTALWGLGSGQQLDGLSETQYGYN